MAAKFLPAVHCLLIHDSSFSELWKEWRLAWESYNLATELNLKDQNIQVVTLFIVIGIDE